MADSFVNVMKYFLTPGSAFFLLAGVILGLMMLSRSWTRRVGRWWLIVLVLGYWLMTLPVVCDWLGGTVPRWISPPITSREASQAIVVLSAGVSRVFDTAGMTTVPDEQTGLNAIDAARLYQRVGPIPVIASGGCLDPTNESPESVTVRELLVAHGVPMDRIIEESASQNTHEQAVFVAAILRTHGWHSVLLVTSPVHLLRARGAFAALGVEVIPAPASFHSDVWEFNRRWTPMPQALTSSEESMYDYLGYFYYWARGWLHAPAKIAAH